MTQNSEDLELTDEEMRLLQSSERCVACKHLDCFHEDAEGERCSIEGCLCSGRRIPTQDEISEMWWLDLPRNRAAYGEQYRNARAAVGRAD